jgi:hypothetical protein
MSKQSEALELARAATPHDELITELLDIRIPKTERARKPLSTSKPLTDSELWEMWVKSPRDVLRFARAIERAHGITE